MPRVQLPAVTLKCRAWNKGRIIGQKRPMPPKQVWAIRTRLEFAGKLRGPVLLVQWVQNRWAMTVSVIWDATQQHPRFSC